MREEGKSDREGKHARMRKAVPGEPALRLGMIVMASGWSRRFGRNKLLDRLAEKPMISYVLRELSGAVAVQNCRGSLSEIVSEELPSDRREQHGDRRLTLDTPIVVTRFPEVRSLAAAYGFRCIFHSDPDQSDTVRHGLSAPESAGWDGCMFLTGDQPMLSEASILRLVRAFRQNPDRVYRLSFNGEAGNPVIFPEKYFENLRNLTGDHGGGVLLKNGMIPAADIRLVSADREFELWDVDTEEAQERLEKLLRRY